MKEKLNEFTTGYPVGINNAQSQEYQGVFGPVDAEAVRGNDSLNIQKDEGLHRLNAFLKHFFRRTTLNPRYEIAQLRARLNHLNYDFDYKNDHQIQPVETFKVSKGMVFGVTPTTDLSKGFDTGSDMPVFNLEITTTKVDGGYKMEAKLTPAAIVAEAVGPKDKKEDEDEDEDEVKKVKTDDKKVKRNKRINILREIIKKKEKRSMKD